MAFTRASITSALNEAFEKQKLGSINLNESAPIKTVQEYSSDLAKVNEAEMDKGFMKEWERNCKVLMSHIKYEQDKKDRENTRELGKLYNMVQDAQSVPSKLANIVGTN